MPALEKRFPGLALALDLGLDVVVSWIAIAGGMFVAARIAFLIGGFS